MVFNAVFNKSEAVADSFSVRSKASIDSWRLPCVIVLVFSSLPASASAYVMAHQMGGDAELMASILAIQMLFSVFLLSRILVYFTPLWIFGSLSFSPFYQNQSIQTEIDDEDSSPQYHLNLTGQSARVDDGDEVLFDETSGISFFASQPS